MKRFVFWLSFGLLILMLAGGYTIYTIYTAPFGSGESRTSPDGSYCARATTYAQRRLFGGVRQYQEYQILAQSCEQAGGHVLWHAEYQPVDRPVLDYGMRDIRFVTWSETSESVTFTLDAGRSLTIPVP